MLRALLHAGAAGLTFIRPFGFWLGVVLLPVVLLVLLDRVFIVDGEHFRNIHTEGAVHAVTAARAGNRVFFLVEVHCFLNDLVVLIGQRLKGGHGGNVIRNLFHTRHAA